MMTRNGMARLLGCESTAASRGGAQGWMSQNLRLNDSQSTTIPCFLVYWLPLCKSSKDTTGAGAIRTALDVALVQSHQAAFTPTVTIHRHVLVQSQLQHTAHSSHSGNRGQSIGSSDKSHPRIDRTLSSSPIKAPKKYKQPTRGIPSSIYPVLESQN